jgi:hypothetical protein
MKKLLILSLLLFVLTGCETKGAPRLDTPENIRHEGSRVLFDEVMHATIYIVEVNGFPYETESTYFDIVETGDISVRVKAQAEGYQDSVYSENYVFQIVSVLADQKYNYSIFSTFDLVIYQFGEDVLIDRISRTTGDLGLNNYSYEGRKLKLASSFLVLLSKGDHVFTVHVANKGSFDVTITINEAGFPYMVSHRNVSFDGRDITLLFALYEEAYYDSEIIAVTATGLSATDYVINDNQLTIKASFIDQYFTNNPDKTVLSIQYTLAHPIANIQGFIFVRKA